MPPLVDPERVHRTKAMEALQILSLPASTKQAVRVQRASRRGLIAADNSEQASEKEDTSVDTEALLEALVKKANRSLREYRRDHRPSTTAGAHLGVSVEMGTSLRPYLPSKELTFQMVSLLSHRTAACGTAFPLLSDPRIAALLSTWCHLFDPLPAALQSRLLPKALLAEGQWAALGFTSPAELRDYLACVVDLCTLAYFTIALTLESSQQGQEQGR